MIILREFIPFFYFQILMIDMILKHAPFYNRYVNSVKHPVKDSLNKQLVEIDLFLKQLNNEILNYSYAEGKWTLKEVLLHCLDVERIMSVRALMISRGETANMPGFNEDAYVENIQSDHISLTQIQDDFKYQRKSNLNFLAMTPVGVFDVIGKMDSNEVSVASLWHIVAGHWNHHLSIIKERYLDEDFIY